VLRHPPEPWLDSTDDTFRFRVGVGPATAPVAVEDLDRVKGIGKKRLEEIRPLVTVE
jgi:hypothetical protein